MVEGVVKEMSKTTWADFVRWCGGDMPGGLANAAALVTCERDATIALLARYEYDDAGVASLKRTFTAERGAPVDPPSVPRERLLALAEELRKEADEFDARAARVQSDPVAASNEEVAEGIRLAESRIRAILNEAPVRDTWLARFLRGAATAADIEAETTAWHMTPRDQSNLPDWLGISRDEYALYVQDSAEFERSMVLRRAAKRVPVAPPKPELVEAGQRWSLRGAPALEVVAEQFGLATFDRLDRVGVEPLWTPVREMLTSPDWLYLGPGTGPADGQQ